MNAYVAAISHAQRRLWFLDRLEPGNPVYTMPVAVRLRGPLDRAALEAALQSILDRHEALRTTFAVENGEPVQVVRDHLELSVPLERIAPEALSARLTEEARQPFDLAQGPLVRARLLTTGSDDHVLLLTMHHIVSDGWSLGVLVEEFAEGYRAGVASRSPVLAELPIQFADFTDWQREALAGEAATRELAEWQQHLAGAPTALELPADFARPTVQSHRGALLLQTLPVELAASLHELARREGATLFMTLLAAFELLLARCTRQTELLIGTPVAGRSRSETERLIGFFVNTLVLRADLQGDPTFTELLGRVKRECLSAFSRQDTPFDRVVDAVQPLRDRSRTPLFQVYFTLQNAPRRDLTLPGLTAEPIAVDTLTAKVDLTLALEESAAGLVARWEYCTDLFTAETAARWARAFETLLTAIAAAPHHRVSQFRLLGPTERSAVMALGGGAVEDFTSTETLVGWFDRQAAATPERTAVNLGSYALSYRELGQRADGLAGRLMRSGVRAGERVGLCSSRAPEIVIGILGILKAGAAYVPLDPAYPRERLDYMMADSALSALVTHDAPAGLSHPRRVEVTPTLADEEGDQQFAAWPAVKPQDAAYVIYTSGSTGRPKGCVVTHENVTRLMRATEAWFGFGPADVWTLFHSYAFDFSVWEIWGALLYGGRLVVVPHEVSRAPDAMHRLLEQEGVTVLNQTPSAFRQLQAADAARPDAALALRTIIFGGEALEPGLLLPWFERHGDQQPALVNMYGITETTVHVTHRRIRKADAVGGRGSVIGERIPDLTLYVVDDQLEPVPVGVPGELLVGGAGLARGYLDRPELTAQRFVANPFGPGRVYRSGDLARWLPDGDLEYLGRIDQQVKIRGFRIELGEIERVLAAVPHVSDCAVIVREDRPGEKRLVAYLVAVPGVAAPGALAAREACQAKLADYMVPAAFVTLERLPLTSNGKLDRKALPAPDAGAAAVAEYVAPATLAERALADVWARVLGVPQVGTQDNFFALGGDSILTIQVVSLAAKAGWHLSAQDLFAAATLADLAQRARATQLTAVTATVAPVFAPTGATYPLTPMQAGMLFQSVFAPDSGVYFEQVWGEIRGALVPDAFRASWQGLLERHAGLRTRFLWREVPEPRQEVLENVVLPWTEHDWSGSDRTDSPSAWEQLLEADRALGFDFGEAPLLRVTLVRTGPDRWRWLWSHHHILLDGWCLPLVFQDVLADYESRIQNSSTKPPSGLPYRAYVDWVGAQDLAAAERYWRSQLAGFAGAPELRLPAPGSEAASGEVELRLDLAESETLRTAARRHGLTLNTVFQGAWALLLQRYGAGDDIVFGVTVSGRPAELEGAESIIGLFINTLPLRVRVVPSAAPITWLKDLQLAQAASRQFEYSPLASVQGWSEVGRGRPLFESILVFENYPGEEAMRGVQTSLELFGLKTRERTNYPLTAAVLPGTSVSLKLSYDPRRFGARAMERLLGHWRTLAAALMAPAADRLGELTLLGGAEQAQINAWSRAETNGGAPTSVLAAISAQVAATPGAPALLGPNRAVSYAELWQESGRLARALQAKGVARGSCVAVCLDKTPELVVALLAVLRAGGAFVPLDPHFARERMAFLVEDARPVALLLEPGTRWVGELAAVPQLVLEPGALSGFGAGALQTEDDVEATDLAYVIHTSGSTGRPKGVMLTHGGLANLARAQALATGLTPGQRVLQFASISFDAAVSEIFMPLVVGAALWLEPRDAVPAPTVFADLLRRGRIDHATLPPALLALLNPTDFPGLRTLLVAGEAASRDLYCAWAVGRRLFNAYGPTEITVCATMEEVTPAAAAVTLGRPLANLRVYVLDAQGVMTPAGVPGEICVGGLGVGRGYLGQPALTAERFVPDPFADTPGARLYRTGDLGRRTEDGRIEFLGRNDHQVKIRGFRIEPGEIEAALATHADVTGALVLPRDEPSGGKHLVAYAVVRDGAEVTPEALRRDLAARLPDYLVPRHIVLLATWPTTSAGKIDRLALPDPIPSPAGERTGVDAPAGGIEETLASIWRDVLRLPHVGADDNFFELGGDSILSLQIVARAHRDGLALTPRQIFSAPTVRGLAALALQSQPAAPVAEEETGPIPLTPIQHWFFGQGHPEAHHWNQSIVLELRTVQEPTILARALAAVMAHHGAFRLRFRTEAAGSMGQFFGPAELMPELPVHPAEDMLAVTTALQAGLDLGSGPLWRAAFFRATAGGAPRLFLAIHHLAVDGVSWRILADDLATACGQIRAGEPVRLPVPSTTWGAWARGLAARADSPEVREELAAWKWLAAASGVIPRDLPSQADERTGAVLAIHAQDLDRVTTDAVLRGAAAAYRLRADEILLAALARVLRDWTGRPTTIIALESHGRDALAGAVDVSRTVGWFTSLYPFLLDGSPDAPRELLVGVKESLRSVSRQGSGFGLLSYLSADATVRRQMAALPRPELCFNYLGQTDHTLGPDAPFALADDPTGPAVGARTSRPHLIDVNALVTGGRLRLQWHYSTRVHRRATIEALAETFAVQLQSLIAHCLAPDSGAATPSDFAHVSLDAGELAALMEDLEEPGQGTNVP